MTNNHVIDEKYIKENNNIKITLNDDNINKTIILNNNNRKIYTNKEYDITIIEIKSKDKINDFMDLDEKIFNEKSEILYNNNHSIYIPQYLNGDKAVVSYGIINKTDGYNINHYCCTGSGSSGSPIINLLNNNIIGIHKEGSNHFKYNKGTYLKYPINEFINQYNNNNNIDNNIDNKIEIILDINKSDINKNIYFLDNTDYIEDKTNIKYFHNNLKELNEDNTELYINNIKNKYQKYFNPEKEGKYKIKLILK